jgi:hypothetical protein
VRSPQVGDKVTRKPFYLQEYSCHYSARPLNKCAQRPTGIRGNWGRRPTPRGRKILERPSFILSRNFVPSGTVMGGTARIYDQKMNTATCLYVQTARILLCNGFAALIFQCYSRNTRLKHYTSFNMFTHPLFLDGSVNGLKDTPCFSRGKRPHAH